MVGDLGHTSHTHFLSRSTDSNEQHSSHKLTSLWTIVNEALFRTDLLWPFQEAFNPGTIISSQELC